VEFTGGVRSYFEREVSNVYDEDVAQKRSDTLKQKFRTDSSRPGGSRSVRTAELGVVMRTGSDGEDRLRQVRKQFGSVTAVDGASLEIGDGELFTLLGPSGCGKTTLLRLIAGFHTLDGGEIWFGDRRIDGSGPTRVTSAWCSRTMRSGRT